ncbi:4Fe-4S single cluster domain-containing protein [Actinophytocola oryzae]|uniref:Anaerobic ribonucleoside-triphosphate reductase activating protein n=1 Tax=Actinophytocola oryzae TaxID=502181 RepID=A0A4V3FQU4_9PSEU|nr:4Fe-4S single cluster domain-containing protein [Actinophytocola oryzae]TDV40971.1 anaerobic ribonucleoside-triphosphate reductase activating protein [Actinophytocola oryzae]
MTTPVRVAATWPATEALGPGLRAAVWVQGCPFRCRGCVAPEWIPKRGGRLVDPEELAEELLTDPAVTGLTLSGGEPMAQATGLAATVRAARARRELDVICFTGFTLDRLRADPAAHELLAELDVLIDGQYVRDRDDGLGLRGSDNQVVHHLTGRLADTGFDFETGPRTADLVLTDQRLTLIGVPPTGVLDMARDFVTAHRDRGGKDEI